MPSLKSLKDKAPKAKIEAKLASAPSGSKREKLYGAMKKDSSPSSSSASSPPPAETSPAPTTSSPAVASSPPPSSYGTPPPSYSAPPTTTASPNPPPASSPAPSSPSIETPKESPKEAPKEEEKKKKKMGFGALAGGAAAAASAATAVAVEANAPPPMDGECQKVLDKFNEMEREIKAWKVGETDVNAINGLRVRLNQEANNVSGLGKKNPQPQGLKVLLEKYQALQKDIDAFVEEMKKAPPPAAAAASAPVSTASMAPDSKNLYNQLEKLGTEIAGWKVGVTDNNKINNMRTSLNKEGDKVKTLLNRKPQPAGAGEVLKKYKALQSEIDAFIEKMKNAPPPSAAPAAGSTDAPSGKWTKEMAAAAPQVEYPDRQNMKTVEGRVGGYGPLLESMTAEKLRDPSNRKTLEHNLGLIEKMLLPLAKKYPDHAKVQYLKQQFDAFKATTAQKIKEYEELEKSVLASVGDWKAQLEEYLKVCPMNVDAFEVRGVELTKAGVQGYADKVKELQLKKIEVIEWCKTLVSTVLCGKQPDKEHQRAFACVEYFCGRDVAFSSSGGGGGRGGRGGARQGKSQFTDHYDYAYEHEVEKLKGALLAKSKATADLKDPSTYPYERLCKAGGLELILKNYNIALEATEGLMILEPNQTSHQVRAEELRKWGKEAGAWKEKGEKELGEKNAEREKAYADFRRLWDAELPKSTVTLSCMGDDYVVTPEGGKVKISCSGKGREWLLVPFDCGYEITPNNSATDSSMRMWIERKHTFMSDRGEDNKGYSHEFRCYWATKCLRGKNMCGGDFDGKWDSFDSMRCILHPNAMFFANLKGNILHCKQNHVWKHSSCEIDMKGSKITFLGVFFYIMSCGFYDMRVEDWKLHQRRLAPNNYPCLSFDS